MREERKRPQSSSRGENGKRQKSNENRNQQQQSGNRRNNKLWAGDDEDIDSDEEEEAQKRGKDLEKQQRADASNSNRQEIDVEVNSDQDEAEAAEGFFEGFEEKRAKLAKKFLERVGVGAKNDEEIAERLTLEANAAGKKANFDVADKISISSSNFFRCHKDSVTCVAVAESDPKHAFTGSKDCNIIQWDVETGAKTVFAAGRRKDFNSGGHFEQVMDISVSEDGRVLLSVGYDRLVRLWDIRVNNKPIDELKGHTKNITAVCAEPDSGLRRFFTTGADLSMRVWDLSSRKCLETFYGHTSTPLCMDVVAAGRPVTGGEDATVRVWKTANESHLLYHYHKQPVDAVVQINPTRTMSGSQDGLMCVWSVASRKPIAMVANAHGGNWITALGCIRYSDLFISGSDDGFIRLWKVKNEEGNKKSSTKKTAIVTEMEGATIPIAGVVSQLVTSADGEYIYASIGKEHRHGRWKNIKQARNGLLVVKLNKDR